MGAVTDCPTCGAHEWRKVSEVYAIEVRRNEPDLSLLEQLAPPTRRASIHGFILALLIWILFLMPFFELDHGRPLRGTATFALLVLVWIPLFLRARKSDAIRSAAYEQQWRCDACGTIRPAEG